MQLTVYHTVCRQQKENHIIKRSPIITTTLAGRYLAIFIDRSKLPTFSFSIADKSLCLTTDGQRQAEKIYQRYRTVLDFMINVLQVSPETAYQDTCRMEHFISEETCQKMRAYLNSHATPIGRA